MIEWERIQKWDYIVDAVASEYHLKFKIDIKDIKQLPAIKMNTLGEASRRPYQDEDAIKANPLNGQIICHCERTTTQEVVDALNSPLPPSNLQALGRRTRAGLGRCQGFYCHHELRKLLEKA